MVLGDYGSGKATMLCALAKAELLPISPLTTSSVPVVCRSVDTDQKEKVIFSYSSYMNGNSRQYQVEKEINCTDWMVYIDGLVNDDNRKLNYITVYSGNIQDNLQFIMLPSSIYSGVDDEFSISILQNADILLNVINALQPVTRDELRFFERVYFHQVERAFFVVNKINMIQNDDEIKSIEEYIKERLSGIFTDSDGNFNERLYNKRIFYTNAYGAMNARLGRETPISHSIKMMISDDETGIPELERAILNYLR